MNNLNEENMAEFVVEALERTAFVLADIVDAEYATQELPPPDRYARIAFTGDAAQGDVILSASTGFVVELASSMLGVEPEQVNPEVEGRDALNELANIIGGSVITALGGEEKHYEYGLPSALTKGELPTFNDDTITCYIESECENLTISWVPRIDTSAAAA